MPEKLQVAKVFEESDLQKIKSADDGNQNIGKRKHRKLSGLKPQISIR